MDDIEAAMKAVEANGGNIGPGGGETCPGDYREVCASRGECVWDVSGTWGVSWVRKKRISDSRK
jgi:hypothetical protein